MARTKQIVLEMVEPELRTTCYFAVTVTLDAVEQLLARLTAFQEAKAFDPALHLQSYASAPEAGFYAGPSDRHAPFFRPIFAAHEMIISEFLEAKAHLMVGTDGRLTEQAPWRGYAGVQWRGFHEERGLLVHSQPLDMDTLETLRTKLDASL